MLRHGPLTHDALTEHLSYDPDTGLFTWLVPRPRGIKVGTVSGRITQSGYVQIQLFHRRYQAHRLAWFYHFRCWPQFMLDHINGDGTDNRISNLREATNSLNQANRKRLSTNTSGSRGVTWHKQCGKWQAAIKVNGSNIHLGLFENLNDASEAYEMAANRYFGEYAA